ncbi:MAG: hypothetical protein AAFV90_16755 [Cyanobacteria bacterium J06634_5]
MMKQLSKTLLGAVLVSVVGVACSTQLKDYTQLTMKATPLEGSSTFDENQLAITEGILANRLSGLGIDNAEIETTPDNQLMIRLPVDADTLAAETILTNPGLLTLRNQKPETEADLAAGIEALQRLLVEQETLVQTEKRAEAQAMQADIEKVRSEILDLFEPSLVNGDLLADARARPLEDNTWAVNIQFTEEGTALFAEQTKLMAGTGRTIGLFLDNVLLSTPVVSVDFADKGIDSGSAVISGNFTKAAAKALEIQLKSGALPVALETLAIVTSSDESSAEETATEETDTEESNPEESDTEKTETEETDTKETKASDEPEEKTDASKSEANKEETDTASSPDSD